MKGIFGQSVPLFKARLKLRPPKATCEKLHYALMAYRGWRMGVLAQCIRAMRVHPQLLQYFDPERERCTDVASLGALVQSLKGAWYETEERALDGWEEEDKSKAKVMARTQHLRRAWTKMRRKKL